MFSKTFHHTCGDECTYFAASRRKNVLNKCLRAVRFARAASSYMHFVCPMFVHDLVSSLHVSARSSAPVSS